jgi:hypothetical protein
METADRLFALAALALAVMRPFPLPIDYDRPTSAH